MAQNDNNIADDVSGSCWGRAYGCPNTESSESTTAHNKTTTCEAWYRCEGVSNYVISWRCQASGTREAVGTSATSSSSSSSSLFKSSSIDFQQCDNSSSSKRMDTELCPPPRVCPGYMRDSDVRLQVAKNDVIDVDIVLSIVLTLFALLVLTLMAVVAYKYWMARRRFRRQFRHHHQHDHNHNHHHHHHKRNNYHQHHLHHGALTTTTPTRKSGNKFQGWFPAWTGYPRHLHYNGKFGDGNGIPYTDVYIPSPRQTRHLLHHRSSRPYLSIDDHALKHNTNTTSNNIDMFNNNNKNNNYANNNSSSDYMWNAYRSGNSSTRKSKQRSKVKRAGRVFGDKSVVTGSFIYQPSILPRRATTAKNSNSTLGKNRRIRSNRKDVYHPMGIKHTHSWATATAQSIKTQESKLTKKNNNILSSPSLFHFDRGGGGGGGAGFYFRGHNRENYTPSIAAKQQQQHVRCYVNPPTPEYDSISDSRRSSANSGENSNNNYNNNSNSNSNNYPPHSQIISSIQIPSYEDSNINNTKTPFDKNNKSQFPYTFTHKYNLLPPNNSTTTELAHEQYYLNGGYQDDDDNENLSQTGSRVGSWGGSSSYSISPYTLGRSIHHRRQGSGGVVSEAASVASKNWRYTVFGGNITSSGQQHNNRNSNVIRSELSHEVGYNNHHNHHTDIVSSAVKNGNGSSSSSNFYIPTPNSPDVISSHNLSRHVTHVTRSDSASTHQRHHHHLHHRNDITEKDTHQHQRRVQQDFVARITVPGFHNHHQHQEHDRIYSGNFDRNNVKTQANDNFILSKNYKDRVHIPGNVYGSWNSTRSSGSNSSDSGSDKALVSQELSYDCFRNEHLRQLARQETVASTSTLDKAVGHNLNTQNVRVIPFGY